jgi:soluble lytic murein transglycosylase-like protein
MKRTLQCIGAVVFAVSGLQAGERVVLTTGFEMHADRHEEDGGTIRIFDGAAVTEIPKTLVAEFRVEEYTPPVAKPEATPKQEPAPIAQATAQNRDPKALIQATVEKQKLPHELVALVSSVIRQESGFHTNAVSPKGAIGLMQLMPATARDLGVDPHNVTENIEGGTRYLTALLKKYEGLDDQVIRALAAYNAGPAAVDKYNGVPPYSETRAYVRRVVKNYLSEQKNGS